MKGWGDGCVGPLILTPYTRWRCSVSLTFRPLYPQWKSGHYPQRVQQQLWMYWRRQKSLVTVRNWLYVLHCPSSKHSHGHYFIWQPTSTFHSRLFYMMAGSAVPTAFPICHMLVSTYFSSNVLQSISCCYSPYLNKVIEMSSFGSFSLHKHVTSNKNVVH
jgi:hypothetical protein